jgi:hypothetical protein
MTYEETITAYRAELARWHAAGVRCACGSLGMAMKHDPFWWQASYGPWHTFTPVASSESLALDTEALTALGALL